MENIQKHPSETYVITNCRGVEIPNSDQFLGFLVSSHLPSGKRLHNYGKIHPFLMGNSTISMAIFNSKLFVYQRVISINQHEKSPVGESPWKNHQFTRPGTDFLRNSSTMSPWDVQEIEQVLRQYGGKLRGPYYQPLGLGGKLNGPEKGCLKWKFSRCYEKMDRIGKGDFFSNISVYHWLIPFITVSQHVPPRLIKWSWKVHNRSLIGCLLDLLDKPTNRFRTEAPPRVPRYPHCISSSHPELSWRNLQIHTNSLFETF